MNRLCVYVAGSYSSDNVIGVLNNIRTGMRISTELFLQGFAPFAPWLDHQYQFYLREGESLSVGDYYEYSISWLRKSDALLVLPNSEKSRGVAMEIEVAKSLGIPIFQRIHDLCRWRNQLENGITGQQESDTASIDTDHGGR